MDGMLKLVVGVVVGAAVASVVSVNAGPAPAPDTRAAVCAEIARQYPEQGKPAFERARTEVAAARGRNKMRMDTELSDTSAAREQVAIIDQRVRELFRCDEVTASAPSPASAARPR